MKYSELKTKFRNKYVIRVVAGMLVVAVAGTGYGVYSVSAAKTAGEAVVAESTETPVEDTETDDAEDSLKDAIGSIADSTKNEKEIGKDETVYMIADAKGNVNKTIVSDWLKNPDKKDSLEDASDLKDIQNVKGDETFSQDGEKLTWQADGNDIYYQGTTDKETPITQKVTYMLDGKEIEPEDLAGKSGKVTIRFDYTNNEKVTKKIDGKDTDVYVPFSVVTGMILNDNFTNVSVNNGKVISDGKNSVVVGIAMPGLKDSLNVDEDDFDTDVEIPDYVEVTAEVEDFSLDMTMTMATTELLSSMDTTGSIDLSKLDDTIADMTDASSQLVDGSDKLADGMGTLKDAIDAYTSGASTIDGYLGQLNTATSGLGGSADTLNTGASAINSAIAKLDQTLNTKMTEDEKNALTKQVDDTLAAQKESIQKKATDAVTAQKDTIAKAATAEVNKQKDTIAKAATDEVNKQKDTIAKAATDEVNKQKSTIEESAEKAVTDSADTIRQQVSDSVTAQKDTIEAAAVAGVKAKKTEIQAAAKATVDNQFDDPNNENNFANSVANTTALLKNQLTTNTTLQNSVESGLTTYTQQIVYGALNAALGPNLTASIKASQPTLTDEQVAAAVKQQLEAITAQYMADAQVTGAISSTSSTIISKIADGAAPEIATASVQKIKEVSENVAAQAAYSGATEAAKSAAVSGAQGVAGEAAVTAAKSAAKSAAVAGAQGVAGTAAVAGAQGVAGTAAVAGAQGVAGTAAVAGAQGVAGEAAYSGASEAAKQTAVTVAEQGKQTIASAIEAKDAATGYNLITLAQAVATGTDTLNKSVPTLTGSISQLKTGADTLVANNGKLTSGVTELLEGSNTLADGMEEFDEKAIEKLADAYNGDVKSLLDRIDAVMEAGEEYTTFSKTADGTNGSVKFIIRTDGVKGEK